MSHMQTVQRMKRFVEMWERMRPNKCFAGLTLENFKALVRPALEARDDIEQLEHRVRLMIHRRNVADRVVVQAMNRITCAVMGDADEGDDGEFYGALGYVRRSKRKKLARRQETKCRTTDSGTRDLGS